MLVERLRCPPLVEACARAGVPLIRLSSFRDETALRQMRDLELDVAVSLGNGIIPLEFFTIPRRGMLNIHHELLPEYRGAQTALWQLHDGSDSSGYSIHEITERLDAGRILLRERVPIQWRRTLRETVVETTADVQSRSIDGLLRLLDDYAAHEGHAVMNDGKKVYTTPGTRALFRIYRNFARRRPRPRHESV
jgi:methionyl-tRNA formyltransferase